MTIQFKHPTPALLSLIDNAVKSLETFAQLWNEIKRQGNMEGVTEDELKDMIRPRLREHLTEAKIYYLFNAEREKQRSQENYYSRAMARVKTQYILANDYKKDTDEYYEQIACLDPKIVKEAESVQLTKQKMLMLTHKKLVDNPDLQSTLIYKIKDVSNYKAQERVNKVLETLTTIQNVKENPSKKPTLRFNAIRRNINPMDLTPQQREYVEAHESEFKMSRQMLDLIDYWSGADHGIVLSKLDTYNEKDASHRKILLDATKTNGLKLAKQAVTSELTWTINVIRRLTEVSNIISDVFYEERELREKKKDLVGK